MYLYRSIKESDLSGRGLQGYFELLFEFQKKETHNIARLLDERAEARHEEVMNAIRSIKGDG